MESCQAAAGHRQLRVVLSDAVPTPPQLLAISEGQSGSPIIPAGSLFRVSEERMLDRSRLNRSMCV